MKICPNCGAENEDNAINCILCEFEFEDIAVNAPEDISSEGTNANSIIVQNPVSSSKKKTSVAPVKEPVSNSKSNKKVLIALLTILIVLGGVAGGLFLMNNKGSSSDKKDSAVKNINQAVSNSSTPASDNTITPSEPPTGGSESGNSTTVTNNTDEHNVNNYGNEKAKILNSVDNAEYSGKDSHIENAPSDMVFYDIDGNLSQVTINNPILYSGPGSEYNEVYSSLSTESFRIVGENSGWYYLATTVGTGRFSHTQYGFASKNSITSQTTTTTTITQPVLTTEQNELKETYAFYGEVATESGTLNLREAPSTDSKVLLQLPKGTKGSIYRIEGISDWYKIYTDEGHSGYVSAQYIRECSDSSKKTNKNNSGTQTPWGTFTYSNFQESKYSQYNIYEPSSIGVTVNCDFNVFNNNHSDYRVDNVAFWTLKFPTDNAPHNYDMGIAIMGTVISDNTRIFKIRARLINDSTGEQIGGNIYIEITVNLYSGETFCIDTVSDNLFKTFKDICDNSSYTLILE